LPVQSARDFSHIAEATISSPIRRKRHEVRECEPPRDVLYVRIQPPIFVDDDNAGQFRRHRGSCVGADGPDQISLDASVPLRRWDGLVCGLDPIIGLRHLLPQSVIRLERGRSLNPVLDWSISRNTSSN
jgi:hypothetical protein